MIFVMLLFSTSWFSWLCFPLSTSFCWLFSLFFVFFSSCQLFCCFSARAANFTWAICRLYNSHNSTVKFCQEAQTEIKGNMSDWLGHTALVSKGSEGVNADCHCLLCLSFCLMPTNSARIPEIHKPEFHRRAKQSHCKDSLLSIFARVLARQMLWFFFFFFWNFLPPKMICQLGSGFRETNKCFWSGFRDVCVGASYDPVQPPSTHATVEKR